MAKVLERFNAKYEVDESTGCWIWTAGKSAGYGTFIHKGKHIYAHRAAYELFNGPIPKYGRVLHTCGNLLCVNPDHLVLNDSNKTNDYIIFIRQLVEKELGKKIDSKTIITTILEMVQGNFTDAMVLEQFK